MSKLSDAKKWYLEAKNRYFGARKNLRVVRDEIGKLTKELRELQERIPNAQGEVLDHLRAREAKLKEKLSDLNRTKQKLNYRVKHRKEVYDRLKKKYKLLQELHDEHQDEGGSSGSIGFSTPSKAWNPYSRQIPNWMIPWLDKSYAGDWNGVVVSGVRTPAYSQSLCYGMCGHPTCPGTCAGIYSNHNMLPTQGYPYGALDVSDYYTFERVQWAIGSPLKNDLPYDLVHFSVTGH
jgi:hypothetical protein